MDSCKKTFAIVPHTWLKKCMMMFGVDKPDILIADKQTGECHKIDVACPFDTKMKEKEQEKVERCHK